MPKLNTKVDTKVNISEKISIGFMVAIGLIVVPSFLSAAGYVGWQKLNSATPITAVVNEVPATNDTTTDVAAPSVKGEAADYTFSTE